MKKLIFFLLLFSAASSQAQKNDFNNVRIKGWLQMIGATVSSIGTDSTNHYGSGSKLITERAAKAYARLAAVTYGGGGGGTVGGIGSTADNIVSTDDVSLGGGAGSALRLQNALATGKTVFIAGPMFTHDTIGITLSPGQKVFGRGKSSLIVTTYGGSSPASCVFKTTRNNTIHDIAFAGTGKVSYPGSTLTAQNAILVAGNWNNIYNIWASDLGGSVIQMYEPGAYDSCWFNDIHNIQWNGCTAGVQSLINAQYNIFSNLQSQNTNRAFYNGNGNNKWNQITSETDNEGYVEGGSGGNNNHGTVSNFSFNHTSYPLTAAGGIDVDMVYSNGNIFGGIITLTNVDNAWFNNVALSSVTMNISATGGTKTTHFIACPHISGLMTPPIWNITGTATVDTLLINGGTGLSIGGGSSALSAITAATGSNSINNASYKQRWDWLGSSFDSGFSLKASPSSFNSFVGRTFDVTMTGNSGATIESCYTSSMTNSRTGSNLTNVALELRATNGADNYGLLVPQGKVSIGASFGTYTFNVTGTSSFSSDVHVPNRSLNDSTDIAANTAFVDRAAQTAAAQAVHDSSQTVYSKSGNKITMSADLDSVGIDAFVHVATIASSATITPNSDTTDMQTVTALATNTTIAAPTGTPYDGKPLLLRIKDDGTSRTLTWNSAYRAGTDFALPTATTISKTMYVQFVYNTADSKWDAVGLTKGF